jgi:hypothetical protein
MQSGKVSGLASAATDNEARIGDQLGGKVSNLATPHRPAFQDGLSLTRYTAATPAEKSAPVLRRNVVLPPRERLPARRESTTFSLECAGLKYTATVSRFDDGRLGELFLSNHRNNSGADVAARDAGIAFSFAVQHGADPEAIRRALCRDSRGHASGLLGVVLDRLAEEHVRPRATEFDAQASRSAARTVIRHKHET